MQYRTMPKSKDKLSSLGLGCMRLPQTADGKIDRDKALEMMHYALEHGVNYYDTAWGYHDGASEPMLGEFISQINRKQIFVATKLPCWLIKTREDMDSYLNQQLERLKTNYIDYYLLHALNKKSWKNVHKLGVIEFLEDAKAQGKIRHIGFSFHDKYPVFKKIVEAYAWDFTQFMLNYLDTHYQAGMNGYRIATQHNMGIISMEPLRGGKLVHPLPPEIEALWKKKGGGLSPLELALRWVWNLKGSTVLLSGMSNMEQLKENIALADRFHADELSDKDLKTYQLVRREYLKRIPIPCSECRYCMPCPFGVAIPANLGTYNEAVMFNNSERGKQEYQWFIPEANRAGKCTACGACLPKCPQHIDIPNELKKISSYFS